MSSHNHDGRYYPIVGGQINNYVKIYNTLGVNSNLFDNSYLTILSGTDVNSICRASIGFHNKGHNGVAIYLDLDGGIKAIWNDGTVKTIVGK